MALTADQRLKVSYYLGLRIDDVTPSYYLNTLTAEGEALITSILADLATIDAALISARSRLKAIKVGSIQLPGGGELAELRGEGRRLVGRLSSLLQIEPWNDIFADDSGGASRGGQLRLG
jgi:hypothetical protein